jgi:hypothetical protein
MRIKYEMTFDLEEKKNITNRDNNLASFSRLRSTLPPSHNRVVLSLTYANSQVPPRWSVARDLHLKRERC